MKSFTTAFVLTNFALLVASQGNQFVTGPCTSDADCAEGCCAFNTGLCAGPVVAQENADGGCGFGNPFPNNNAALALGFTEAAPGVPGSTGAAVAVPPPAATTTAAAPASTGKQFITGPCTSDADCAEGCCAFNTGLCAAPLVASEPGVDGGCGFGDASPNNNALIAQGLAPPATAVTTTAAAVAVTAAAPVSTGKQFITGACTSDADCAEGCCAFNTGKCAAPLVASEPGVDGGCGFGDAQPNDNALEAQNFRRFRA